MERDGMKTRPGIGGAEHAWSRRRAWGVWDGSNGDGRAASDAEWTMGEVGDFLVPARDTRAIRFFLDHLFVPRDSRDWIGSRLLRYGTWLAGGEGFFRRHWHVSLRGDARPRERCDDARASEDRVASTVARVTEILGELRRELSRVLETERFSWILLGNGSRPDHDQVVLFLFRERESVPAAVVKLRRGAGGRRLHAEWQALRYLASQLPRELAATLPSPAFYDTVGDARILLLRFLPGRSMELEIARGAAKSKTIADHFVNALVWLACFQITTRRGEGTLALQRKTAPLLEALSAANGGEDLFWVDRLDEMKLRLPLSACHGDFRTRDLLTRYRHPVIGGPRLEVSGVTDWEHFAAAGAPYEDLFHFAVTCGLSYPWRSSRNLEPLDAFELAFLEDNELSLGIRSGFSAYCDLTGIPFEALRPLFHLFLLSRWHRTRGKRRGEPDRWLALHRLLGRRDAPPFRQ